MKSLSLSGLFAINEHYTMRGLALLLLAASCSSDPSASAFKVATDKDAEKVVRAFLDAAQAGDAKKVAERVCQGGDQASAAVAGPLKITGYRITRIEPAWVGAE